MISLKAKEVKKFPDSPFNKIRGFVMLTKNHSVTGNCLENL